MLNKILGFEIQPGELIADYSIRTNSITAHLLRTTFQSTWAHGYHSAVYRWAGHMARISLYDPW